MVVGKTWTDVNLNQLGEHLGRAGKDRWVVLLVDKDTPWVHIQWMMMICAEQRMPKLAFQVKGFRLDASLLVDPGVGMGPAEAEEPDKRVPPVNRARDIAVKILALPGDEVEAAWGVAARRQRVMMPTTVRYKFAGRESDELASVARWMTGAMKAAPDAHGVIQAMAKTRFGTVAKLLAEFRHAGFKRVDFFGTRIPSRAERTAITLPYPPGERTPKPKLQHLEFGLAEGDAKDVGRAQAIILRRLDRAGIGKGDFGIRRSGSGLVSDQFRGRASADAEQHAHQCDGV